MPRRIEELRILEAFKVLKPHIASVLVLFGIAVVTGCNESLQHQSRPMHAWGETKRGQPPVHRAANCPILDSTDSKLIRLRRVAERITENNPLVFEGSLALSELCIALNLEWDKPQAHSQPGAKIIFFSPQMLLRAQSDDELAAVLSHELAHISLQHQGFGEAPPRAFSDVRFLELNKAAIDLQKEIARLARKGGHDEEIFELSAKFAALQLQMNERIDLVYGEKNAHLNWIEQEADEAGAEFFVRAGFNPESYLSMLWRTSSATPDERIQCEQMIQNALQGPERIRPERGNKNHPTTCWRSFHLKVDEWAHSHADEIDKLVPKSTGQE